MVKNIFILFFAYFMIATNSFVFGKAMLNQAKEIAEKNNLDFVSEEKNEAIENKDEITKKDTNTSGNNDINDKYYFLRITVQEFNKLNQNNDTEINSKILTENIGKRLGKEIINIETKEGFESFIKKIESEIESLSKLDANNREFNLEELEKIRKIFENEKQVENFTPPYSIGYYESFNSFMFQNKNINLIRKMLEIYSKNNSSLNKNNSGESEEEGYDINVGNVYLKSIMYVSKNYWAVWINDKKISNENNNDEDNEFFIKKVNRNTAEIQWRVSKSKWNIINYENAIDRFHYHINGETNKVEFDMILHPNQTFMASTNEIIDGRYRPITKSSGNNEIADKHLEDIINGEDIDLDLLIN